MIKVEKGQDPYSVIGRYIRDHVSAIEDMIAVIEIDGKISNELFMVDMTVDGYFIWQSDWYEGEETVVLIDFFSVSDACNPKDVQPDFKELIAIIKNGISATNADDVYSCGMRNGMRWVLSLIDGKEPSYESSDKMDFLDFLWNVINPNEMEMYLAMYNRKGALTNG